MKHFKSYFGQYEIHLLQNMNRKVMDINVELSIIRLKLINI